MVHRGHLPHSLVSSVRFRVSKSIHYLSSGAIDDIPKAHLHSGMRPNIPALTSLRFFAALIVVIFHYNLGRPLFPELAGDFGYQAVSFFFVLSGFILVYAHGIPDGELNISFKDFIKARLVRISPSYYLAIAMIVLLFFIVGILDRMTPIATVMVLTMLQSWTPSFALSLNPPAWSLSNEAFFYLLFPILWRVTCRMSMISSLMVATGMVLLVALVRGLLLPDSDEAWNNFRLYFPLFNLPQFVLGVALAYALITVPCGQHGHTILFYAGVAALVILVLLKSTIGWPSESATLSVICGSLIFGAAGSNGFVQKALSWHPLVILGEASYSIYILHFPIWLWWNHYTRIVHQPDWSSVIDFGIYISIVLVFSIAALVWVERPARHSFRKARERA
jgi:peptidoglycan/LPS O-acetylase OafA/YrhL